MTNDQIWRPIGIIMLILGAATTPA
jgi:hypothetical protein